MVEMNLETKRLMALEFLRSHTAGVLATVSREGKPHASVVYYTSDEHFSIYFLTLASSRKYQAMQANPWAAFVVGTMDVPQTLQIEGPVVQLHAEDEMGKHLPDLMQRLTSNATYFAPITKMDPADIVVMWLEAKWIRWGNYAISENGNEHVFTELDAKPGFLG
ncbi:MAG TPA: pyridoxamine 5'-phosphate oxidase family protein [Candidatus Paceibacterota bacterium]|nr:pyridoxamine 5'-phosphate oxidase family protein [Candidatus Paceibacterota bacterium]